MPTPSEWAKVPSARTRPPETSHHGRYVCVAVPLCVPLAVRWLSIASSHHAPGKQLNFSLSSNSSHMDMNEFHARLAKPLQSDMCTTLHCEQFISQHKCVSKYICHNVIDESILYSDDACALTHPTYCMCRCLSNTRVDVLVGKQLYDYINRKRRCALISVAAECVWHNAASRAETIGR